jgi:hypothetical protein
MRAVIGTTFDAATLDPNKVSPGLLGFIIVVIIGLITWFLARSMAKQLRKLDAGHRAEEEAAEAEAAAAEGPGEGEESAPGDEIGQVPDKSDRSSSGNPATNGAH